MCGPRAGSLFALDNTQRCAGLRSLRGYRGTSRVRQCIDTWFEEDRRKVQWYATCAPACAGPIHSMSREGETCEGKWKISIIHSSVEDTLCCTNCTAVMCSSSISARTCRNVSRFLVLTHSISSCLDNSALRLWSTHSACPPLPAVAFFVRESTCTSNCSSLLRAATCPGSCHWSGISCGKPFAKAASMAAPS